ncbi:unnamed protein product [Owenia fusiformis]|uniref:Neuroendocrine protein 7B2 n=1 Tax=Owenia fusiformis TaxID=6347 RepID=A0A8J1XWK2_OWEFU|nr:unnamed protein product [Owenia fusiformis]
MDRNRKLTREELIKHKFTHDAWIVVHNKVYDITKYINDHPGGRSILKNAGGDATKGFEEQIAHKYVKTLIKEKMEEFYVGYIEMAELHDTPQLVTTNRDQVTTERTMQTSIFAVLSAILTIGCFADSSYDMLLNNLYQMAALDPDYFESDGQPPLNDDSAMWQQALRNEQREQLRDQEHEQNDPQLWGYQYISGGAGEGKQHLSPTGEKENKQEVKSDDVLPFYCHPPNPCPYGYTEKDGCKEMVKDEKDFQQSYLHHQMGNGECSCDKDHMDPTSCPQGGSTVDAQSAAEQRELDNVIEQLLGDQNGPADNPFAAGEKRGTLVSKKHFQTIKKRGEQ